MLRDTPICDFGWQAPDFKLKDPNGVSFEMREHLGDKGLLIAFICNHCPYVKTIATRFAKDTQALRDDGINVLGLMSNDYRDYEADSPENMTRFARAHGFVFPYLVDEDQRVGKAYGAVCTPDFFGFNNEGAAVSRTIGRCPQRALRRRPHLRVGQCDALDRKYR